VIRETCGCGAVIEYPDHLGIEPAENWRETHCHKPKEERQPEKQGAGFASVSHGATVTPPAKFHERAMA
jgi:hypothetical protein